MPRSVTISLPSTKADPLVDDLRELPGMVTLHRQPGASVKPPGDVLEVEVVDRHISALVELLRRYGAGSDDAVSVTMSEPAGMLSSSSARAIRTDASSASLEEMEFVLHRESTMDLNKTLVMVASGVLAVVGIATNAVHIVIGAMVIAPGFEPMLKVALGLVARSPVWRDGLSDIAKGYAALAVGAAATALLLPALGVSTPAGSGGYLGRGVLVGYWGTITLSATLVTIVAGAAGALLVAATRSVLTAGVMIALALVPAAALAAMGLVDGDLGLAADGALRWLHDVLVVFAVAAVVFWGKRRNRDRVVGGQTRSGQGTSTPRT